jgi:hypothetical protein
MRVRRPSAWDKTRIVFDRLKEKKELEERKEGKSYQGRQIITRDTPVLRRVYLSQREAPAIVVDPKYGELKRLYNKAKAKATVNGKLDRNMILNAVFDTVLEEMPVQDALAVERLEREKGFGKDRKVALDHFIKNKTAVCKHDALATAALLEMFKEEGIIRGTPRVNRNQGSVIINGRKMEGEHAWCRYTNSAGEVIILDPALKRIIKLKDLKEEDWTYENPAD